MKKKSLLLLTLSSLSLFSLAALPAWSAGSIVFTHQGKPVTAIPLDQLTELSITVNTGGVPFKKMYSGQWSGLDQAQTLKAQPFKKGSEFPDLERAYSWPNFDLILTSQDSNWGNLKVLKATMRKGAPELSLFRASSEDDLAFTSVFYRKCIRAKPFGITMAGSRRPAGKPWARCWGRPP